MKREGEQRKARPEGAGQLAGKELDNALNDAQRLQNEGKLSVKEVNNYFMPSAAIARSSGVAYSKFRDHFMGLLKEKPAAEASEELVRMATTYGVMVATKKIKMPFEEFAGLVKDTGLGVDDIKGFAEKGLKNTTQLAAALHAVKNGVPAAFVEQCIAKGMKFVDSRHFTKVHAWSGHFPLEFIASRTKDFLALPEGKLGEAEAIAKHFSQPGVRFELLKMGVKPDDVKTLVPHFASEKVPALMELARRHGVPAGHVADLHQEGVQPEHLDETLSALRELKSSAKQIGGFYKQGLRSVDEMRLANELGGVKPEALPSLVRLGINKGLKIDILRVIHEAASALNEKPREVWSALYSRTPTPEQMVLIANLEEWNPEKTKALREKIKKK